MTDGNISDPTAPAEQTINGTQNGADGIVQPRELDAAEKAELTELRTEFATVEELGQAYHSRRALFFRRAYRLISQTGRLVFLNYVEKVLGFDISKVRGNGYGGCAIGILGIDVYKELDEAKRHNYHNRIQPMTQALDALFYFKNEHEQLDDCGFTKWWTDKGRLSGLYKGFKEAQPRNSGKQAVAKPVSERISAMVANANAFEVAAFPGLQVASVGIYVAQGQGDKARLVRLDVTPEKIASLAEFAPDEMNGAPENLLLYRQLLMATNMIPEGKSEYPKRPLQEGEKASVSTEMLDANAIVLVRDGRWSIAKARVYDTVVLEVVPAAGLDTYMPTRGEYFVDTLTWHNMREKLSSSATAANYIKQGLSGEHEGAQYTVKFKATSARASGRLIAKPLSELGSVWTHQVSDFRSDAQATLSSEDREQLIRKFLAKLVKKKDDHPVTVDIGTGCLSLQHGAAQALPFSCPISGAGKVRVAREEFVRSLSVLLELPLERDLVIAVDKRGLLRLTAQTNQASFSAHIQALRDGEKSGAQVRERALLQRVARPEPAEHKLAA